MSDTQVSAPAAAPEASEAPAADAPAAEAQAAPATKKKPPAYRDYTIGNEKVSLSDDDIARDYSKWKGADAKFREAAAAKQSVEAFMRDLEADPEKILNDKRLPINKRKLAEKWLTEQLEAELSPADPRDAKLSDAERRLKEYEDRDNEAKTAKEQAAYDEGKAKSMARIGETLKAAGKLTHLSGHPESEAALIREMALYMRAAKEQGDDVTPEELVSHIHNQRFHQFYTLANQYDGDELIDFLGDAVVSKLRKADLARLKASREGGVQSHKAPVDSSPRATKSVKMDGFAAREHARRVLGGK
jgi:hypothetical protein